MIHDLRTLVDCSCDRAQLFHELQTLGVLREESKQLGKAVVDATIGFLTKSWKPCYMKTDMRKDMEERTNVVLRVFIFVDVTLAVGRLYQRWHRVTISRRQVRLC